MMFGFKMKAANIESILLNIGPFIKDVINHREGGFAKRLFN